MHLDATQSLLRRSSENDLGLNICSELKISAHPKGSKEIVKKTLGKIRNEIE